MADGMPGLTLRFFGGCEVTGPAGPVRLESNKTSALLAYLAVEGGSHSRPKLAGLLWGELPDANASRNLRRALWDLKRKLSLSGDGLFEATRSEVSFHGKGRCWIDVDAFRAACGHLGEKRPVPPEEGGLEGLQQAVLEGRGNFLDGLFLEGAPGFEEWLYAERERLRCMAAGALGRLAGLWEERGNLREGLECARHLVALDPWLEEGHRTLMRLLALRGEPAAALHQYETLRRILAEELQVAPTPETTAMFESIRSGSMSCPKPGPYTPVVPGPRHNLPLQPTPFVGRAGELAALGDHLRDPDCRLLTLLGPGGTGKTRLALRAAGDFLEETGLSLIPDGAFFISLAAIESPLGLPAAIRSGMGLTAPEQGDDRGILDSLRGMRVLLLLDGFEQVLEAAEWLARWLDACPGVRILATSRERLNLRSEWVFQVPGMYLPDRGTRREALDSDAVRLFLQCARRADLGFSPNEDDLSAIVRICRRVESLPLGIELAAAWVLSLTPEEIAREIHATYDFLSCTSRDAPERQRSLRAVFDHSWRRLSGEEREVFAALSAFAGGFCKDAARAVAGASSSLLSSLVDKSLLRRDPEGRYRLHAVLRQYGAEELETQGRGEEIRRWHAAFYLGNLRGPEDAPVVPWVPSVVNEIENIRAAWRFAAGHDDWDLVGTGIEAFTDLHDSAGQFQEGLRCMEEAAQTFGRNSQHQKPEGRLLLGRLLSGVGALSNRMGQFADAAAALEESVSLIGKSPHSPEMSQALCRLGESLTGLSRYREAEEFLRCSLRLARRCGRDTLAAEALGILGRIARERGDFVDARRILEEGVALARTGGGRSILTQALNQLAYVASYLGDFGEARKIREEALAVAREAGDRTSEALALSGLGVVALLTGAHGEASARLEESLSICKETGDIFGVARALANLAENAREQGLFEDALRFNRESMGIHEAAGNRHGLAMGLANAGLAEISLDRPDEARSHLRAALGLALELGALPVVMATLSAFARLLEREGDAEGALEVLGFALAHPAATVDAHREAKALLGALEKQLGAERYQEALGRGRGSTLEEISRRLNASG